MQRGLRGEAGGGGSCQRTCALASDSCCNKLPPTGELKATQMYSLAVLEAGSPKSSCQQVRASSGDSCLSALGGPRRSLTCGCITPVSASVIPWPPPLCEIPRVSFVRALFIGFSTHLDNPGGSPHLKILNNICKDPFFHIRKHSQVLGVATIQPTIAASWGLKIGTPYSLSLGI